MRITPLRLRPKANVNSGPGGVGRARAPRLPSRRNWMQSSASIVTRPRSILFATLLFGGFVLPPASRAQVASPAWPPIAPEELALKDNPASHGSHAMILFQESIVDDPHSSETEYFRIKIFDEEGKKYGDIEIPYFEKETQIEDIRARTVRPDGTIVEFQGVVYDRIVAKAKKLKYQAKVLTLPNVQAGSIIEYSYRFHWHQNVPDWFKNPADYIASTGVYSMRTASWQVQRNLFIRRAHFAFHPYPKAHLRWVTLHLKDKEAPLTKPDRTVELELEDIPAFEEEDFMPPESTLRKRVDFFYISGLYFSPESFWNQRARQNSEALEAFLSKHKKADRLAAATVAASDPPEVKLHKLYARAQQTRNLSYEHSRTEKEQKQEHLSENKNVDDIVERGYGGGNEINYLFVALARAAGFDAQILLLTSRARDFFSGALLDPSQLNSMVVAVQLDTKKIYLDPATHLCPYPLLPWEESGTSGVQLGKFGGMLASTPDPVSADAVIERKATLHLDKDGIVQGQLRVSFLGQEALTRRRGMNEEDAAGRRKELEDEVKAWLPAGATVELSSATGWEIADEPLRAEFNVTVPNLVVTTPHRIMLPLAVSVGGVRNPLQHSRRTLPVYFSYPYQETDEVTIEVPAGYQVEAIPAPRKRQALASSFEVSSQQQGNSIVLKRHLVIDGFYYKTDYYAPLRAFFDEVISSDGNRAVLKLVEAATAH